MRCLTKAMVVAATVVVATGCAGTPSDPVAPSQSVAPAWQAAPAAYRTAIAAAIAAHGCSEVTAQFAAAQLATQSAFSAEPHLVSAAGAVGPAQLMPQTIANLASTVGVGADADTISGATTLLVAHDCDLAARLRDVGVMSTPASVAGAYIAGVDAARTPWQQQPSVADAVDAILAQAGFATA